MGLFSWLTGSAQADAAKKAAKLQSQAADKNRAFAERTGTAGVADLEAALQGALGALDTGQAGATGALQPYAAAGTDALGTLRALLGLDSPEGAQTALTALQASPAYQFNYDQGLTALERARNAGGRMYSGGTLKAAQEYGQGYASNALSGLMDRIGGLVTGGQNAAGNISNAFSNFAGDRAQALLGTGQLKANTRLGVLPQITGARSEGAAATAGGIRGAAEARSNALSNILGMVGNVGKTALGFI